jgi:hypothetical protein
VIVLTTGCGTDEKGTNSVPTRGWTSLGSGLENGVPLYHVSALVAYGDEIVARGCRDRTGFGGNCASSGGTDLHCIAVWRNEAWPPLEGGVRGNSGSMGPSVSSLLSVNHHLFAGGDFRQAGGQATGSIAMWDGGSWRGLDGGVNGVVHALAAWRGRVVVWGSFSKAGETPAANIAVWTE